MYNVHPKSPENFWVLLQTEDELWTIAMPKPSTKTLNLQ